MVTRVAVVSVIDAVTDDLRTRVLSGELEPEAALAEVDVADTYEVARPTAKAAIENLVRERLLVRSAHKTARVVRLSSDDARDIYRTRAIIEAEALRALAQTRRVPDDARAANAEIAALDDASPRDVVDPDMRFHRSLIDALGSERTSRVYASLASEVVFCMSQVQGASLLPTALIADEHERLLALIEAGDGDAAAALLREHLARARERLVERLGGEPGPEARS
ncbi:transcriptional regulator NanR [Microbacterium ginsengisoli]|uniref:Transcriptional regulator NanR n=1 Tax=Microbacterium ginsengisoli TaxID=400772 RepID=A0A0F0LWW5_9MICO|nr:GntR family transcriptional regulator [Microbacterium ginsengisoli]KJL38326.1 transcriptional regulator NanR [Microbacterium ginsengisoli]